MSDHDQLILNVKNCARKWLESNLCSCDDCRLARHTMELAVSLGNKSRELLTQQHREVEQIRAKLEGAHKMVQQLESKAREAEARAQAAEQKLLAVEKGPTLAERLATGAAETSKVLPYSKE